MRKYVIFMSISIMVFFSACVEKDAPNEVLFQENGSDWFSEGDAKWNFNDGELVGTIESGSGFVMTEESYSDFELELEFKPDSIINSGIFIRCKENVISKVDCYEINIWDLHPDQKSRTGAVVTRSTPLAHVQTLNKWNSYKIRNQKDHLQAWVNDVLVVDLKDLDLKSGPLALQAAEKGKIKFRNVRITKLE